MGVEWIHYDSGEVYDGEWKFGQRDGKGVCRYNDRSFYDGTWRKIKSMGMELLLVQMEINLQEFGFM